MTYQIPIIKIKKTLEARLIYISGGQKYRDISIYIFAIVMLCMNEQDQIPATCINKAESHKIMFKREAQQKSIHTLLLPFYKIQAQAKLIHGISSQAAST